MSDQHCAWKAAVAVNNVSQQYKISEAVPRELFWPHDRFVRPIWASTRERENEYVAIPTVVGQALVSCGNAAYAAGRDKLWIFVNPKQVMDVHNSRAVGEVRENLNAGDVLAIKVVDFPESDGYGLASFIRTAESGNRSTSSPDEWVAAAATVENMKVNKFAVVDFPDACS